MAGQITVAGEAGLEHRSPLATHDVVATEGSESHAQIAGRQAVELGAQAS